jgi:hypothetical protein
MTVYFIAIGVLALALLAGVIFLSHSMEKRRIRRQRLITALRARRNSFLDLANSFPDGFLSNDLTGLLYRALIDICDKLINLEPKDPSHAEQLELFSNLAANLKQNAKAQRVRLENPQQIKEARGLLQELERFILQQTALKLITTAQAESYIVQLKRLVLQLTVDSHIYSAKQAQQIGKARLAVHHYNLAKNLLADENANHAFDKQIAQLVDMISKLEEKITPATPEDTTADETPTADSTTPASKEWDQFAQEGDTWKRKNIYD